MDEENFLASMGGISVEKLRDSAKAYRKANNQGCDECDYFGHTVNYKVKLFYAVVPKSVCMLNYTKWQISLINCGTNH